MSDRNPDHAAGAGPEGLAPTADGGATRSAARRRWFRDDVCRVTTPVSHRRRYRMVFLSVVSTETERRNTLRRPGTAVGPPDRPVGGAGRPAGIRGRGRSFDVDGPRGGPGLRRGSETAFHRRRRQRVSGATARPGRADGFVRHTVPEAVRHTVPEALPSRGEHSAGGPGEEVASGLPCHRRDRPWDGCPVCVRVVSSPGCRLSGRLSGGRGPGVGGQEKTVTARPAGRAVTTGTDFPEPGSRLFSRRPGVASRYSNRHWNTGGRMTTYRALLEWPCFISCARRGGST
ncbi:hypothetical protein FsymDg_2663 [Candidatus Protofrankia datiscae]|uniref:Uncharacterized protein n=1 Tax=Candidatus Protofrankia datiscae TaxID=2716812 RepID=F8B407_9ACTN|nr:hypothetical protein FsymDg_2663 [Candidatus Protofrankia datiscae]